MCARLYKGTSWMLEGCDRDRFAAVATGLRQGSPSMFSTQYTRRQRFRELMHSWCPLDYIKPVYFGLNISFMTRMNSYSLKYDIMSLFLLKVYFKIV